MGELYEVDAQGRVHLHFHAGQYRAWMSEKRIVCILAGAQSGKTVFGLPAPVGVARRGR